MKKRIISLIVLMAIAVGFLPVVELTANAATPESIVRYCEHCDLTETWQPLTNDNKTEAFTTGHYYLTGNIAFPEKVITGETMVCLELNSYTYTGNRHMTLESGVTLNIQGDGNFCGRGKEANEDGTYDPGGAIWIKKGATLNLYGGTLSFKANSMGRKAGRGGVLGVYGTFNMFGGDICNGEAAELGGNLFVDPAAEFNMYSGSITGGVASSYGDCVYSRGKTILANDAAIEELVLKPKSPTTKENQLTIQGKYSGCVCLDFAQISVPEAVMGISKNADISDADIYFNNNDLKVKVVGDTLMSYLPAAAEIRTLDGETVSYNALNDALAAVEDGETLTLNRSVEEALTINKSIILNLNGRKINNTVTVAENKTLSVMDSFTADYSIADGVYGRIQAVEGDVKALHATENNDAYLMIEDSKGISFHAVGLNIKSMALRPAEGGLYFKNNFAGDSMVADRITSFGVALSVAGAPDETTLTNPKHFTSFTADQFNTGEDATSTLLTGILKDTNGYNTNQKYAAMPIYGRAYAEFGEGQYLFGVTRQRSMKEQVVKTNEKFSTLSQAQKTELMTMYNNFPRILGAWELDDLKSYITDHEKNTMKIMILGSSRSVDSFWLLHEALKDLYPDKEFVLGIMYYSSCSISMHVDFIKKDSPAYVYYRNADGNWETFSETTMQEGLRDQAWDIVVLQGGNGDTQNTMNLAGRTFLTEYVDQNVSNPHTFWWHSTWANPNDEVFFSEGWDPQPPAGYKDNLITQYGFDPVYQLTLTQNAAKQYVLDDPMFEGCISSGSPVMYANNILGVPQVELYRDYTHLTDFGRLLVAYAWCVQLTGQPITEINMDTIDRTLRHRRAQAYGDMTVTDEMKDVIIQSANYTLDEDNRWSVPVQEAN